MGVKESRPQNCPICGKSFARLDMHIGNAHGDYLLAKAGYTDEQPKEETKNDKLENTPKEFVDGSRTRLSYQEQPRSYITDNKRVERSPLSKIKTMLEEQNEILTLQVVQKNLVKQLKDETPQQNQLIEMFKLQKEISDKEYDKQEKLKKEIIESITQDDKDDFSTKMLMSLLAGVQTKNVEQSNTGNEGKISDTGTQPEVYSEANSPIGNQNKYD